jgi:hypothetical protein
VLKDIPVYCTDAAAIHDLVLSWLWPLWTPPAISLHLHFQHIIGPGTSLPCRAVPTLQPITWACQPPLTCSCHGLPFSTSGTHCFLVILLILYCQSIFHVQATFSLSQDSCSRSKDGSWHVW